MIIGFRMNIGFRRFGLNDLCLPRLNYTNVQSSATKALQDLIVAAADRPKIIGHDSLELEIWVNRDDRAKFLGDLRHKGSLREVECQLRSRRGSVHTLLQSADIIEINCEPHMLDFCFDVTERKQAEAETGFKRVGAAVQAQSKIPPASCEFASMAGNDALD
jgi:hypothetical protein